jgi:hypothetical protein
MNLKRKATSNCVKYFAAMRKKVIKKLTILSRFQIFKQQALNSKAEKYFKKDFRKRSKNLSELKKIFKERKISFKTKRKKQKRK